ncbi:ABC transporter ATP-binding protein [Halodesulfovibrio marinisediminis]|uniref:Iron complex transport system ATP-binding protein n=1 Tax=Halodesulfovibrio marinisediminis DSM 17456 TaxID=1121457 RepID=A0A1N6H261_9BACT|nr:ABC transporter ATP-binding protein [Halodesulfovibrio marinisediminis]SIO13849.1 iron complex transport system ATP-binding protein [Halodesulfovibrio marinisediminis DSM 17456]
MSGHITINNLSAGYANTPVLHDVSLSIQQGEMVGLLGPNGCGKTTLLLSLSGVKKPLKGAITLNETSLLQIPPKQRAAQIASVPQYTGETPDIEALSLVLMGRYPYISALGGYSAEDKKIALSCMKETATNDFAYRSARGLSGGEFQRVLIARALAQQADTMLLDEATSGLDIARTIEIFDLLKQRHSTGTTVVAAIHDINLAALYCTRLIFLKHGRVILDGSVEDVFTDENLTTIYDTPIHTFRHPVTNAPQAFFTPGSAATFR